MLERRIHPINFQYRVKASRGANKLYTVARTASGRRSFRINELGDCRRDVVKRMIRCSSMQQIGAIQKAPLQTDCSDIIARKEVLRYVESKSH